MILQEDIFYNITDFYNLYTSIHKLNEVDYINVKFLYEFNESNTNLKKLYQRLDIRFNPETVFKQKENCLNLPQNKNYKNNYVKFTQRNPSGNCNLL